MSWFSDAKGEWEKLPGGGKVAVAGIGLLVVGVAGYEWYINRNSSATASSQAGVPPNPATQGIGGLSALDTASLANMIAGLVNTQGKTGDTGAPGPPGPPPTPTPWKFPTLPKGDILWKGTSGSRRLWYGTNKSNQLSFNSLFPTGTTFRLSGRDIFYTIPGGTEAKYGQQLASHTPGGTPPPPVNHGGPSLPSTNMILS